MLHGTRSSWPESESQDWKNSLLQNANTIENLLINDIMVLHGILYHVLYVTWYYIYHGTINNMVLQKTGYYMSHGIA